MTERRNHVASGAEAVTQVQGLIDQCRDIFSPESVEVMHWTTVDSDQIVFVFQRTKHSALDSTSVVLEFDVAIRMLEALQWIRDIQPEENPDDHQA